MSESKHTPGPWNAPRRDFPDVYGPCQRLLAVVYAPGTNESNSEEGHANARLIAAAPDLLEACEGALEALEGLLSDYQTTNNPRPADNEPAVAQLVAAIAKAKGGE